ncbi:ParA family protein [Methylobacterium sp. J-026]|uniref:ParA family protein n=1 Tax=Methylobacterium sp. J-026 TaxID=2836624 RepID=UPI001FBA2CDA|nr:ParA family protein [Methylobacterium sp. J-026]MCJ2134442.1 ParA family protein [Methylobacterium sp. J-026]
MRQRIGHRGGEHVLPIGEQDRAGLVEGRLVFCGSEPDLDAPIQLAIRAAVQAEPGRDGGAVMRVLTLTTQKGDSGEFTLAASLAVAAMQDGETVAALDTDPQASLAGWGRRREANGLDVQRVEPSAFAGTLGRIREAGAVSLVIVDPPGRFGPDVALVLREASLSLLPVKPSILRRRGGAADSRATAAP